MDHRSKVVFSVFTDELTDEALLSQCAETSALPITSEYRELVDLTESLPLPPADKPSAPSPRAPFVVVSTKEAAAELLNIDPILIP